ncbi:MAG: hypothetical protein FGM39_01840 [Phycisphaerales bacterium]|nr:hypothetical protein [Phycisphaerales bacterium]
MNAPSGPAAPAPAVARFAALGPRLASSCLVGVAAIACFQALVSHPLNLWFDVDPASDPFPFPGIAPSTGMMLDAVAVILAAVAVWILRSRIDGVGIAVLALAATGAAIAFLHALAGGDQCWRALQWIAAMLGAASIASCLRALPESDARIARAMLASILVAGAVPIVWRGAMQVLFEHPATVEAYMSGRAEFLAARGWAEGSPQALTYERRLMQAEATGWFGLSNVASSVFGAAAIAATGAACALWRVRRLGAVLVSIVAVAAIALVLANGSKGAIAAVAIGAAFAAFAAWGGVGPHAGRLRVAVALAALALPLVAVAARGAVGLSLGERSLLFRAQYAEGALGTFARVPSIGVGPAGFGDAYLRVRPELSPEEVQSAHAAWADWIASLGVGGVAWIALLGVLVAWCALAASPSALAAADTATPARPRLVAALAVLAAAMLSIVPDAHALDDHALLQRVLAALFAAAIAGIMFRAVLLPGRAVAAALAGAALLLAVHAQVEMTLWWPGALGWVAALIAVVAGGARPAAEPAASTADVRRLVLRAGAAATIAASAALLTTAVPQARAAERAVEAAARPLAEFGLARLGLAPTPTRPIADDRLRLAAEVLSESASGDRWLDRPSLRAAARAQLAAAVATLRADTNPEDAERIVDAALAPFEVLPSCESDAASGGLVLESILASDAPAARARRDDAAALQAKWAESQVTFNPRSVRGFARLADARARAGDAAGAADAARRALAADDSYALDPLRQLPAAERARLGSLSASPSPAPR